MGRIKCCEHCVPPKRHIGCHGTCPEYAAEKQASDEEHALICEARNKEGEYYAYVKSQISKHRKRKE